MPETNTIGVDSENNTEHKEDYDPEMQLDIEIEKVNWFYLLIL
jgi:hypothetical protein